MSYTIFDFASMFMAMFGTVFLLGLQSNFVRDANYPFAICNSFLISVCNFVGVKYTAAGNAAAFWTLAAGGCCGICVSIFLYQNVFIKMRKNP